MTFKLRPLEQNLTGWGNLGEGMMNTEIPVFCAWWFVAGIVFFQGLLEGKYLGLKSDRNNCDLQQQPQ